MVLEYSELSVCVCCQEEGVVLECSELSVCWQEEGVVLEYSELSVCVGRRRGWS